MVLSLGVVPRVTAMVEERAEAGGLDKPPRLVLGATHVVRSRSFRRGRVWWAVQPRIRITRTLLGK